MRRKTKKINLPTYLSTASSQTISLALLFLFTLTEGIVIEKQVEEIQSISSPSSPSYFQPMSVLFSNLFEILWAPCILQNLLMVETAMFTVSCRQYWNTQPIASNNVLLTAVAHCQHLHQLLESLLFERREKEFPKATCNVRAISLLGRISSIICSFSVWSYAVDLHEFNTDLQCTFLWSLAISHKTSESTADHL